jgi:NAD(P) transhydrogenase subunit beta
MTRGHVIETVYLLAAVCFILALKGLSSPKNARTGNLIGAGGMLLAVAVTFADRRIDHLPLMIVGIVIGTVVGVPAARQIKMTAMPQMVAAFNGAGGGAAALVGLLEFTQAHGKDSAFNALAVVLAVLIGGVSFTGSIITFLKLQEIMTGRPIVYPGAKFGNIGLVVAAVVFSILSISTGNAWWLVALLAVAMLFGIAFVLPVGGADVPVVISLLNAFTGLAVAASGFVLQNVLLIVAGTLVGASGTLLTQMMSKAMGRSIANVLFGAFSGSSTAGSTAEVGGDRPVKSSTAEDIGVLLSYSHKVVIVPGYGLAVAQAQHTIHELANLLEAKGVEVSYAIHPVAGRMPGHMNVLLAEANVPYEQLKEMDEINPEFDRTDVALVVGANDVVNPAARDTPSAPIYGMPILDVDHAQHVIFLKRSMRPGFAGIENELLFDGKTTLLFGDAKKSLTDLVSAVKSN